MLGADIRVFDRHPYRRVRRAEDCPCRRAATRVLIYGDGDTDETFHSKIVLADRSDAYVGSANLLNRSKGLNLECGLMVEGPVVASISTLVNAVLATFDLGGAIPR